ncbi:MAG: four helix bundle protein [Alphaproteobacteria bacterium]|nr:four helix bundle protein [Alphaproteobacteria bacterium]
MERQESRSFNQELRKRTFDLSVNIYKLVADKKIPLIARSIISQLIRSSSSVAANYRSATRARSDAEFFAKICIVLEECDETEHWLEFLISIRILSPDESRSVRDETDQLLRIFSTTRKKLIKKRDK